MSSNFTEVMQKRSDSELLEIVTKFRKDYQSEAIEAAESEIKNRNLSPEKIEQAKEVIKENELNQKEKENEPLGVGQKILFFVFFWGIIPWAMAGTFNSAGYLRKYKEAWRFMKYGFLTFIGITGFIFLIAFMSFS